MKLSDFGAKFFAQRLDILHYLLFAQFLYVVGYLYLRLPHDFLLEVRQRHREFDMLLIDIFIEGDALVSQLHVSQAEKLELVVVIDPAAEVLSVDFELKVIVELFPLFLHLSVYFAADVLVGFHYHLATRTLTHLLVVKHKGLRRQLQQGDSYGNPHENNGET
jgi:hypothetical protein